MEEEPPYFILSVYLFVINLLSSYGWYILLGITSFYYVWTTILKPKYSSIVKKDSSPVEHDTGKSAAIQDAREKLQERYNNQTKLHSDKMKEKEEEKAQKRKEMYKNLEKSDGHKLGSPPADLSSSNSTSSKKTTAPGYFPLMGAGSSTGYRPSRSSGAKRGG